MHISKTVIFPTMKKLTLALLLIFSCATAWAADFDKGLAAYKAGDFATALAEFKPLAEQGDAELQFILSQMYESGTGVLADAKEGIRWLKLAAENGHGPAQFLLGHCHIIDQAFAEHLHLLAQLMASIQLAQ